MPKSAQIAGDTPPLIRLGAFLFDSPLLSGDGAVACSTCHVREFGFSDSRPLPVGIGGAVGYRKAPALLNLYAAKHLMWDGRAADLVEQVAIPLESPAEMGVDWPAALDRLGHVPEARRFLSETPSAPLDKPLVTRALAAYVRSLVSGGSRFDRYYFGEQQGALSEAEKRGLRVFVRKGKCLSCHLISGQSALLTDDNFHSVGVGYAPGGYKDRGRYAVTGAASDDGAFKTPTLRNVALRRHFMHDGSMGSLREVVDYYDRGGNQGAPNMDGRIARLFLTEQDKQDLIAFLGSLTANVVSVATLPRAAGDRQ